MCEEELRAPEPMLALERSWVEGRTVCLRDVAWRAVLPTRLVVAHLPSSHCVLQMVTVDPSLVSLWFERSELWDWVG